VRLWLLSHLEGSPGNALVEAAAGRAGLDVRRVDPRRLDLTLAPGRPPTIAEEGRAVALPDAVFTRMGSSAPTPAFVALRQLEAAGVPCVNASAPLEVARDKARSFQALAAAGVPLPATVVLSAGGRLGEALLEPLGPPPWIVKLPVSTQGLGVARVDSLPSLRTVVDVLRGLAQQVLVQRYVAEAAGTDVRVLVVDGRAVAAMRRRAQGDEVRSNLHRGGKAEAVEPTGELARIAAAAAGALGLRVAGVDLLPADEGPLVIEVNGSPGLEGLEKATGRDLATEVLAPVQNQPPGA